MTKTKEANMTNLDLVQGDSLDDLLGKRGETVKAPVALPESYQPKDFSEPCPKCRGTGRFIGWSGRSFGQCFTCKGVGKRTFKTAPEKRQQAKMSATARKERDQQAALEAFRVAYPDIWQWMDGSDFAFAVSLRQGLEKYGSLTQGQIDAARNAIAKRNAARAEVEARKASAPEVDSADVDRLMEAFDKARVYAASRAKGLTIRNPKITIGNIVISPARAGSKNAGALYVKGGRGFDATYFGKIAGGKFFASRDCSADQQAKVLTFIADPKAAAQAYGQETGVCCICNATLTSEWRLRGIGPICAEKFGW